MIKFQPSKKESKSEKVVTSFRIDLSKLEELDKIASKTDISRNELIIQCIDFAINNIDFNKKKFK